MQLDKLLELETEKVDLVSKLTGEELADVGDLVKRVGSDGIETLKMTA